VEPEVKPRGYWSNKENQRAFFDQLAIKLNIQKPEDWNKVPTSMLEEGKSFLAKYYNFSVRKGMLYEIVLEIILEINVSSVAHTMCGLQRKH
jgi:hypothetical protein